MEIKDTVKTKLIKAKNKVVAFAAVAAPYIVFGATCGVITYTTATATYAIGYNKGTLDGIKLGRSSVIETISDLAKNVGTK